MLVSPHPAVSLGSRSLSTGGVGSRVRQAPMSTFGYRSLVRVGSVVP